MIITVLVYVLLHLWTLSWFPFVHSDEVWLASLTRGIAEQGLSATEDFFILTPRYPHALKSLYHVLQIPFLQSDWSIVSARFLSLISALLVLLFLFLVFRRVFSLWAAFFLTFLLAFDSWFFSASHMGRQEMMILLLTVLSFFCLVKGYFTAEKKDGNKKKWWRYVFFAALFVGVGIFVHPNSCIAMAAVLPWVLALSEPAQRCKSIFLYLATCSFFLCLAAIASVYLDSNFFAHYWDFGVSVGVGSGFLTRLGNLKLFIAELLFRRAGTYYMPPSIFQFVLFILAVFIFLRIWFISKASGFVRHEKNHDVSLVFSATSFASVGMVFFALFVIGKYSPPSGLFIVPWMYIFLISMLANTFVKTPKALRTVVSIFVVCVSVVILIGELYQWYPRDSVGNTLYSYSSYVGRLNSTIGPSGRVLANLNTGFAFPTDRLRVWRDLGSLPSFSEDDRAMPLLQRPLARFLIEQDIEWIVFPVDELEYIYRSRPVFNSMYGNPHRFYPDTLRILDLYGTKVDSFSAPWYGMRLVPLMDKKDSRVFVYHIELPVQSATDSRLDEDLLPADARLFD